MQGVLWPENTADRELGRPVLPPPPLVRKREGDTAKGQIVKPTGKSDEFSFILCP
jgi:hypothetical protein